MAKKTIEVAEVLEFVNNLNKLYPNKSESHVAFRKGVNAVINHILMRTDNYHGFRLNDPTMEIEETAHYYTPSPVIVKQYQEFVKERKQGNGFR